MRPVETTREGGLQRGEPKVLSHPNERALDITSGRTKKNPPSTLFRKHRYAREYARGEREGGIRLMFGARLGTGRTPLTGGWGVRKEIGHDDG